MKTRKRCAVTQVMSHAGFDFNHCPLPPCNRLGCQLLVMSNVFVLAVARALECHPSF